MLRNHPIIKSVTLFILPYIVLYALYIQINGEVSPGGGFITNTCLVQVERD